MRRGAAITRFHRGTHANRQRNMSGEKIGRSHAQRESGSEGVTGDGQKKRRQRERGESDRAPCRRYRTHTHRSIHPPLCEFSPSLGDGGRSRCTTPFPDDAPTHPPRGGCARSHEPGRAQNRVTLSRMTPTRHEGCDVRCEYIPPRRCMPPLALSRGGKGRGGCVIAAPAGKPLSSPVPLSKR